MNTGRPLDHRANSARESTTGARKKFAGLGRRILVPVSTVPHFDPAQALDSNSGPTLGLDPGLVLNFCPGPDSSLRFPSLSQFQYSYRSRFRFVNSRNKW
ncbi:hypothetical protein EVAR_82769_1 [Eumeta japonica]|uniref:Uncharacterized protein n=1 Tax=Eumeta variegata TaxID=151549 RepID=A0A4C1UMR0_EUMVA|nr:hypothetical protein EVAR_82769_1 [Eumeta japonica]